MLGLLIGVLLSLIDFPDCLLDLNTHRIRFTIHQIFKPSLNLVSLIHLCANLTNFLIHSQESKSNYALLRNFIVLSQNQSFKFNIFLVTLHIICLTIHFFANR